MVAWDVDREAVRTFRVDRIDGLVQRSEAGEAQVPGRVNVERALPDEPWQAEGEDTIQMRVLVDAVEGPRVADEVGRDKVTKRHDDGSVEVSFAVSSFASIRSWVLGLLDHATVLEPADFRAELVAWLQALTEPLPPLHPPAAPVAEDTGASPSLRPAPGKETSDRLRRLLAIVGWLAQVGQASIADVSKRFGIGEQELVAELELAACCGTPPYTPDTLMEIEVSEDSVRAFLPSEYARPRRLTPAEGFAVAASARLLLAVPGSDDDALRRALAKLDAALGSREAVGLDVDAPAHLAVIREATDAGRMLDIDYHSGSRDELTTRTVEPVQVITVGGHWYLDAFCHRAGDMRRFRVDRIVRAQPLDAPATAERRPRPSEDLFVPGPGALEVHLQLGPEAQWVPESVPVRAVGRDSAGTATDVVLDVEGMAWFERLLLQLGPSARVVSPPELTGLAADAARRVLARYGSGAAQ
jgi:proteasome accessory factor C